MSTPLDVNVFTASFPIRSTAVYLFYVALRLHALQLQLSAKPPLLFFFSEKNSLQQRTSANVCGADWSIGTERVIFKKTACARTGQALATGEDRLLPSSTCLPSTGMLLSEADGTNRGYLVLLPFWILQTMGNFFQCTTQFRHKSFSQIWWLIWLPMLRGRFTASFMGVLSHTSCCRFSGVTNSTLTG